MNQITLDIKEFNPKEAELVALAESCNEIDRGNIEEVKTKRKELQSARVEITKYGKALRDGANKFAKDVIAREKELVAIIAPKEDELDRIEEEVKQAKIREERKALLPTRRARLATIGCLVEVTDDELLEMDGSTFEICYNKLVANKMEADRAEIARQQAEIDLQRAVQEQEAQRLENERKTQEREAQARIDERERVEREHKEEQERKLREEEERKAKLEADQRYQVWLEGIGYEKDSFILAENVKGHVLAYKLVATYQK